MAECQTCACAWSVARLAAVWTLSVFWSVYTTVLLLLQWFQNKNTFFEKKKYERPKVFDEWTHSFSKLTKVQLHYVEDGDKEKPLMLMIHGFPEFWYSWRYQLKHFKNDYHVVAIDLRGYNESDKPEGIHNYDSSVLVEDIREFILSLGEKKAIILSHDWGAALAWRLATEHPDVVDKLVIMNCPHPRAFGEIIKTMPSQFLKSWYMFMFQMPFLPEFTWICNDFQQIGKAFRGKYAGIRNKENFTDDDLKAWKYTFSAENAFTGPINFYRAAFQKLHPESLPQTPIKAKTLILWGTADRFLEKAGAALSAEYCETSQIRFIEGASHWVQQDEPGRVNAYIEEFLK